MFLKTYNSKSLMMLLAAFIFSLSLTLAQEKSGCCSSNKEGDGCSKTMQDSTEKVFKETSFENFEETVEVESIVRMGKIDLAAIDNNEDEKVYQDQMCWNVISDEAGEKKFTRIRCAGMLFLMKQENAHNVE